MTNPTASTVTHLLAAIPEDQRDQLFKLMEHGPTVLHGMPNQPRPDASVIDAFVDHLREKGNPDLQLELRPDEIERNRPAPDAVAGSFVIEHTSMDTIPHQRRDAAIFRHLFAGIETELASEIPYRLSVYLPYHEVAKLKGSKLAEVREALRSWVVNDSPTLTDGPQRVEADGIPFSFHGAKRSDRPPGLFLGGSIGETAPDIATLRNTLTQKIAKLVAYEHEGKIAVLLVESGDPSLMNETLATEMIGLALGGTLPPGLDRAWFVDTCIPGKFFFSDLTERIESG